MAQHTITITDQDGGVAIRFEGNGPLEDTPSGLVVKALISVAQRVITEATEAKCDCPKCQTKRNAAEPKPTLH